MISLIAGYLIDMDATSLDGEDGDGRGGTGGDIEWSQLGK